MAACFDFELDCPEMFDGDFHGCLRPRANPGVRSCVRSHEQDFIYPSIANRADHAKRSLWLMRRDGLRPCLLLAVLVVFLECLAQSIEQVAVLHLATFR